MRPPGAIAFFVTTLLVTAASAVAALDREPRVPVRLAVTAFDDVAVVQQQLAPLVRYLEEKMDSVRIEVQVLDQDGVEELVRRDLTDIVITGPYHYLRLRGMDALSGAIATVQRQSPVGSVASLGGTIVVRGDRGDLQTLADLDGRRVAVADRRTTGGYVLPLAELERSGVSRADIDWRESGSQTAAVRAVVNGSADAAFLRSSLLESFLQRGTLKEGELRVINRQELGNYPFAVSTRLYPEWPVGFASGTDRSLLSPLIGTVLLRPDLGDVPAGAIAGLQYPADYESLHELLRTLRLPPHDTIEALSLREVWVRYGMLIVVVAFASLVLLLLLALLWQRNRRLHDLSDELHIALESQHRDAQRLTQLNNHFELFLERTTDFVYFKDDRRRFLFASRSLAEATGAEDRRELEGKTDEEVFPGELASEYVEQESRVYEEGQMIRDLRESYERPDGSFGWVSTYKWPVFADDGETVTGLFGISRDITDKHHQEQQLKKAAHYDALTGLPNRNLFFDRLKQAMAIADRHGTELAVVYLDVDHFKAVNDRHGHLAGDEVLVIFARRLASTLRRSDTVARLGGDEFVLLLADLEDRRECMALLDRLMVNISAPVELAGETVKITASAGLSFYTPAEEIDADQLLRQADQAMYRAKQAGRNRYRVLNVPEQGERRAFFGRVEEAVESGRFELHYQPIVELRTGELAGVEALLRWRDESGDILHPESFLPMLFGHPLAQTLANFVLKTAIEQLAAWRQAGLAPRLHVNVAAADLGQPCFLTDLRDFIGKDGLEPGSLCLEILESAAVSDPAMINRTIAACRELGVHFALDDFGTGYSSLSHLKDLKADCVKIDQRFVQGVLSSYDDCALLAAIIAMSQAFGREVIAEGVETAAQARMLLRIGCSRAQGFAIARPMPAAEFVAWLAEWRPDPAWTHIEEVGDPSVALENEEAHAAGGLSAEGDEHRHATGAG